MTSDGAMEVAESTLEPMDDSSTSSSGEENSKESGQEDMEEGSDQEEEEREEKPANPAFSKFMQGFWDLASVDVPVRCVDCWLLQ